ncbi:Rhodanese-like protein [Rhizoclosmatium globosum]|uniref:Rhodanese-like protein n=1 Tax=Rhizoclosmatium globosum TaxID=329046 RepID=A0A1Y2C5H0_9FUNG|nr:hypothetical protein HDU79_004963 [Rhizoclosmatium sp. JEL0117]ORY42186.1 Rhodanese-like protein [Rhizoclosmatium globosum]|eukprot:ORY42186.1 Rhodanese-like protein [Rhizoclosmatium globosum]
MSAKTVDPDTLASWIKDPTLKQNVDYLVVDVRDNDFAGGNIKGAVNIPAHELQADPHSFDDLLSVPKRLVFHCLLSQVRGPKTANVYLRTVGAAEGQEIYVLTGGFSNWQSKYGKDTTLTENYNQSLWENGGYD